MTLDRDDPNWPSVWSHPPSETPAGVAREAVPLERHLLCVADRARETTPADAETADGNSLRDAAEIVALAHDFGKATTYFQRHVRDESVDDAPTHHARLGGLLAYYALRQRGYGPRPCFAGLVAVARHHGVLPNATMFIERGLEPTTAWRSWNVDRSAFNGHAVQQAKNIDTNRPEFARALVARLVGDAGSWAEFLSLVTAAEPDAEGDAASLRDCLRETFMVRQRRWHPKTELFRDGSAYLDELRLYGTLTFADKTRAAGVSADDERIHAEPITAAQIEDYLDGLSDDAPTGLHARLNAVRSGVQAHIGGRRDTDPIQSFLEADSSVATLTLPTGYGKTLTGLLAAARIRESTGGTRVVYALPFTSVIDQTADVLRELLRTGPGDTDPARDRRLTVHHNLSESLTLPRDNADTAPENSSDAEMDRAAMLAESWRAGLTLTTFVQLFESLAGPRNAQSVKLPALHESVVVLDEPQALPLPWWPLVARLVDALVREYDATVVLMTATQPRIVDGERTVPLLDGEVVDSVERAVGALPDRVEYDFHPTALASGSDESSVVDYDDAAATLATDVRGTTDSVLAICNTIDSAAASFDASTAELRSRVDGPDAGLVDVAARFQSDILDDDRFGTPATGTIDRRCAAFVKSITEAADEGTPAVLFLSTRLRPCDRRFLLAVADELTAASIPLLVVSTQLVEAGVDVSFDRVVRDFAPLDSIVQAAGRCNRSFERAPDTGRVTIWRLAAPGDATRIPSEAVYARRERATDTDLLQKTRDALDGVATESVVAESTIAGAAVTDYHDAVGDAVATMRADNDLRQQFDRAAGDDLRRTSLIDSRFSFEVYVCRSEAERDAVEAYRDAERAYDFDEAKRLKKRLAAVRVSVPAYRADSDTARALSKLPPLSRDADERDATERVWTPGPRFQDYLDAQTGFDVPESTVDARLL